MTNFKKELSELLNKHSKEGNSNTPDFILASFLIECLKAFDKAVNTRNSWYKENPLVAGFKQKK